MYACAPHASQRSRDVRREGTCSMGASAPGTMMGLLWCERVGRHSRDVVRIHLLFVADAPIGSINATVNARVVPGAPPATAVGAPPLAEDGAADRSDVRLTDMPARSNSSVADKACDGPLIATANNCATKRLASQSKHEKSYPPKTAMHAGTFCSTRFELGRLSVC